MPHKMLSYTMMFTLCSYPIRSGQVKGDGHGA